MVDMFDSLVDTVPSYGGQPLYAPGLKNHLHIGSFVQLQDGDIVRVVSHEPGEHVVGNLFVKSKSPPPFTMPRHPVIRGLSNQEVHQTLQKVHFEARHIEEIVFVFHADRVTSDGIVLHGIGNAFICRFHCSDLVTGELLLLEADNFCSFPSDSEEFQLFDTCYPYKVWTSVVQIQDTFRRMLSSRSEKQGMFVPRKMERLPFAIEGWGYLCRRLKASLLPSKNCKPVSMPVPILLPGCSRTTVRRVKKAEGLFFQSTEQLDALCAVYGAMMLFGVRKARPKINEVHRLCVNDIINVLSCDHDEDDSVACPSRIQLVMDRGSILSVCLSYGRYQYSPSPSDNGKPQNCPSEMLEKAILFFKTNSGIPAPEAPPIAPIVSFPPNIKVGHMFEYDEHVFVVQSINRRQGEVYCRNTTIWSDDHVCFSDVQVVSHAITEYNT
jgi:hypothetical protein